MNVELKRIAEKKLEQMGATVHGVLAKNEAGAWAAVSDAGRVMWLDGFEGRADETRATAQAENEALRAQLKEYEEKGRALMDMCRDLRARVTRLSEALQVAVDTPELRGGTWRDMAVAALADGQKGCDGD